MTTTQMADKIRLELYMEYLGNMAMPGHPSIRLTGGVGFEKAKQSRAGIIAITSRAVAQKLEKKDTPLEKVAGYGLCSATFFYLAGHIYTALLRS